MTTLISGKFGKRYIIKNKANKPVFTGAELSVMTFKSFDAAHKYVATLNVSNKYLKSLVNVVGGKIVDEEADSLVNQVSLYLLTGQLTAYWVKNIGVSSFVAKPRLALKPRNKGAFTLAAPYDLQRHEQNRVRSFANKKQAMEFIQELKLDDNELSELNALTPVSTKVTSPQTSSLKGPDQLESLAELLVNKKLRLVSNNFTLLSPSINAPAGEESVQQQAKGNEEFGAQQEEKEDCDVGDLQLIFVDSSGKELRSATDAKRSLRANPLYAINLPVAEHDKYKKVSQYDAILEVLAPPLETDATDVKKATIAADVQNFIGTCPSAEHQLIKMTSKSYEPHDGITASNSWKLQSVLPMDVYGKSMPIDDHVGKFYLRDVLYFFEDASVEKYVKEIEFVAEGCGLRSDGSPVNKSLKGLVRVYREDTYSLEISIPSVVNKSASFKREVNLKGEETRTHTTWDSGKTDKEVFGKNGDMTSYAISDGNHFIDKSDELNDKGEITSKTTLKEFAKITHNGRDMHGLDSINNLLTVRRFFIDGFKFIDELKNAVPQVGFGWSVGIDVCAGTIGGKWGLEAGTDHDTPEYKWVGTFGEIKLALTIIKLDISAFFGVECKSPDIFNWFKRPAWEIIAKVEIKIVMEMRVDKTIRLAGKKGANKVAKIPPSGSSESSGYDEVLWTNTAISTGEISAQFKVTVAGYGMDAKSGVTVSFAAKATIVKPFKMRLNAKRNEAYLYAYFTHFKRKKSPPWKKVICKENEIMKERYVF